MRALLIPLLLAPPIAACASHPEPAPGVLPVLAARYACGDGTRFTARFPQDSGVAVLDIEPDFRVTLTEQRPASGIWYGGGGWDLRGKGDQATLTRPDGRASACRSGGTPEPVQDGATRV